MALPPKHCKRITSCETDENCDISNNLFCNIEQNICEYIPPYCETDADCLDDHNCDFNECVKKNGNGNGKKGEKAKEALLPIIGAGILIFILFLLLVYIFTAF